VVDDIRKNKGVDKALAKILYNHRHITPDRVALNVAVILT
jgi:hypothetical protein